MTSNDRLQWAAVSIGCVVAALLMITLSDFATDDAYITLRYARQWAQGHGLSWNAGELPVEGYSNFLHVGLGAASLALGLDPFSVVRGLNVVSLLALIALTPSLAQALGASRWSAAASAVLVGAHIPLAYWGVSGLETVLYTFFVTCALRLFASDSPRAKWWLVASLVALSLCRAEGPIIAVVLALATLVRAYGLESAEGGTWVSKLRRVSTHCGWILAFGVSYGAYFTWRVVYFGHLFPNTVYAKSGTTRAGEIVWDFVIQNPIILPLALVGWLFRRNRHTHILVGLVALHGFMLWNVHPSVADLHRFFLPVWPGCVVLAALGVTELSRRWGAGARAKAVVGFVTLAGLLLLQVAHPASGLTEARRRVGRLVGRTSLRTDLVRWMQEHSKPTDRVAIGDVGLVGYLLPNPIVDLFGLNSTRFTHEMKGNRRKFVRSIVSDRPELIVLVSRTPKKWLPKYGTDKHVTKARVFRKHYRLEARLPAPIGRYSYWIHRRK